MALTVSALHTTPVKSTQIRAVDAIELDRSGARGDRAFYVVDETGALVNGKRIGSLHTVIADYAVRGGTLTLRFPDGEEVGAPVRLGAEVVTSFFGAPRPARVLDGPWSAALSHFAERSLRIVTAGSAVDRGIEGAVSLVSRGSLERLAEVDGPDGHDEDGARSHRSGEAVDPRRFRMLIEIDGVPAHEEDRWVGREIRVGEARLRIQGHVGRCVTTTRGAESGEVDLPTLKMLATYRLDEPTTEPLAFGVHGEVLEGGSVRIGDAVVPGDGARA